MNDLKIQVGEIFEGKRSKVKMQIVAIEHDEAVIREVDTGRQFSYCIDALRRCEMVPVDYERSEE